MNKKEIEEIIKRIWIDNTAIREELAYMYLTWFNKGCDEWFNACKDINSKKLANICNIFNNML